MMFKAAVHFRLMSIFVSKTINLTRYRIAEIVLHNKVLSHNPDIMKWNFELFSISSNLSTCLHSFVT